VPKFVKKVSVFKRLTSQVYNCQDVEKQVAFVLWRNALHTPWKSDHPYPQLRP